MVTSHDDTEQTDRRKQILDAALRVFGTKGFHKATNKDIAVAAGGISPGLIYWYFKDKEDLFVSLVRERTDIMQLTDHAQELMNLPPRVMLSRVGKTYLSIFRTPGNAAMFRIVLSEMTRFPQIGEMLYRGLASKVFNLLNNYLQHQVERGVFRPHDTTVATRSFIGMFIIHILAREILRQPEAISIDDDAVVATAVELFVRGLEQAPG